MNQLKTILLSLVIGFVAAIHCDANVEVTVTNEQGICVSHGQFVVCQDGPSIFELVPVDANPHLEPFDLRIELQLQENIITSNIQITIGRDKQIHKTNSMPMGTTTTLTCPVTGYSIQLTANTPEIVPVAETSEQESANQNQS